MQVNQFLYMLASLIRGFDKYNFGWMSIKHTQVVKVDIESKNREIVPLCIVPDVHIGGIFEVQLSYMFATDKWKLYLLD